MSKRSFFWDGDFHHGLIGVKIRLPRRSSRIKDRPDPIVDTAPAGHPARNVGRRPPVRFADITEMWAIFGVRLSCVASTIASVPRRCPVIKSMKDFGAHQKLPANTRLELPLLGTGLKMRRGSVIIRAVGAIRLVSREGNLIHAAGVQAGGEKKRSGPRADYRWAVIRAMPWRR